MAARQRAEASDRLDAASVVVDQYMEKLKNYLPAYYAVLDEAKRELDDQEQRPPDDDR